MTEDTCSVPCQWPGRPCLLEALGSLRWGPSGCALRRETRRQLRGDRPSPPPLWEGTAAVSSHGRGQRSARRPRPRRRGARLSQPGVVQLPSHRQGQAQGAQAGGHSGRPAQTSRPSAPAGSPGPLPRDTRTTPAPHAESQEPPLLPPPAPGCCREHPECERRRTPPSASTRRTPCCSLLMALAAFGDIKLASQEV